MRRIQGWLVICAAVLVFVWLAKGVVPMPPNRTLASGEDEGRYYHIGKTPRTPSGEGECIGPGCHDGAAHKREANLAAFRNMHSTYVDCLVCHAPDGMDRFEGRQSGKGHLHLGYKGRTTPGGSKGHPSLGPPAGCRRCHSESAAKSFKERGVPSLPSNFADPIALRMHEGGARKWNP